MIKDYMAIVYLIEPKDNIAPLTKVRPLASIPVGGSYRIIDFCLSNLVNSGIRNIGIFSRNEDLNSLRDHIGMGAEWDLARKKDGIFLFRQMANDSMSVNIERVKKNIQYFFRSTQKNMIVCSPHMVCNINIVDVIKNHEKSKSDVTIVYKNVKDANMNFNNCNSVKLDPQNHIKGIGKNLFFNSEENISLDMFVINKSLAVKLIIDSIHTGNYHSIGDLIINNLANLKTNPYEFKGLLYCINSTQQYFNFNMNLLNKENRKELLGEDSGRYIYSKTKGSPPSLFKSNSIIENSLISNGCIIDGTVKNSILSRGTVIEEGAFVEDCIILQDCYISSGATLKNIIVDKNNIIKINEKLSSTKEYPLVIEKKVLWDKKKYKELMQFLDENKESVL